MGGSHYYTCPGCGATTGEAIETFDKYGEIECGVCEFLGDRSLVKLLAGKTTIEQFREAGPVRGDCHVCGRKDCAFRRSGHWVCWTHRFG